jgi:paraquat-inducible protein A
VIPTQPEDHHGEDLVICPVCQTIHARVPLEKGIRARCSHCGTILYRNDPYYLDRTLALTVTGIILFIAANLFPLVQINLFGNAQFVNIPIAIAQLLGNGFYLVGLGITLLVLVIPILVMGSYAVVLVLLQQRRGRWMVRNLLVLLSNLLPWSMVDVFVISILVALVKLTGEVSIHLGVSFWALSLYVGVDLYLTKVSRLGSLWEIFDRTYESRPKTLLSQGSVRCPVCEAVNPDMGGDERCVRCGSRIYPAPRVSLGRSWAFLVTAMILYLPANYYPVLELKNVLYQGGNTIIGGVIQLWDQGSYVIALIILVSSVFIPILKFILLLYLFVSVRYPVAVSKQVRHRLHSVIEVIGPWSMIDVFVVSILAGLVKYESFNIVAGQGAAVYVLMVFFTMLSALSFDPRLIQEKPRNPQEVS